MTESECQSTCARKTDCVVPPPRATDDAGLAPRPAPAAPPPPAAHQAIEFVKIKEYTVCKLHVELVLPTAPHGPVRDPLVVHMTMAGCMLAPQNTGEAYPTGGRP